VDFDRAKPPRHGWRQSQHRRIDIAPHRLDRRNRTKLVKHGLRSYVAGMQDLVGALQQRRELRIKVSVGVGNDANSHRSQESEPKLEIRNSKFDTWRASFEFRFSRCGYF
jgi:hypothetical protein